ncbi:unnamed protein product (macronuclear) [Paramecium tetraurelia]|uniref:Uncharacterized protein n=1 Tax=Paramecium tetraurelia TaxID=5888 RepID=A0C242_PARTE|nr:uncharacterized protein GSPATT00034336001 [Paramecium tetraurelia]CAK64859.1 unnamed protein product [Paramecium tetraurelia]|eukprot:XP_001432256.1 hypothetical protein (macronuclear) [Paramecium tetraurelia strain d4-2]
MQYFNNQALNSIIFDTFSLLNPVTKERYRNPALTKNCLHHKACFELEEALKEIQQQKLYQCPHCNQQAFSKYDLVQDWRVEAYKEFNEEVDEVIIIKGMMFNKCCRNKYKYLNFFTQPEYYKQFEQIFERVENDMQIVSLIRRDLQQQQIQNNNNKIIYLCFCLLDKVKINIPVRIRGCQHYECYELTSLLNFQIENRKKIQYLECKQPFCSNRLRIAHKNYSIQSVPISKELDEQQKILDIQTLFSGISVDLDLLNVIKKSNPSSFKFYYNKKTENIEEDINKIDGKAVDPFIVKFYLQHPDVQQKMQYQEFQKIIQQQTILATQGGLLQEEQDLSKQLTLQRYRNYQVNMIDKLTQLTIEYPVRCKLCRDLEVCMDIRSYIAQFIYFKKFFLAKGFSCPICNQQLGQQILRMNIQNYIYLDPNILSYMYQNMSNIIDTKIFEYHGEQYMLQDFKNRQKIKREDYVASLLDRIVVFRQLFCRVNFELRIRQPLILYNCPDRKIVDFKSFYQELKKINFDLEKQGLILCRCNYCYRNPIKFIAGQIYFHEAFYEALNKYYQIQDNNQNESHFTYTFADTERDSYIKTVQLILPLKINFQRENGSFWDMMSDEKYQSLFRGSEIQGYKFKLFAINFQTLCKSQSYQINKVYMLIWNKQCRISINVLIKNQNNMVLKCV